MKCKIDNCNNKIRSVGLCLTHYKRFLSRGEEGLRPFYYCKNCNKEVTYKTYFGNGNCQDCYSKTYYKENIQKWIDSKVARSKEIKAYNKDYYIKNRDKLLQKDRVYWSKPENKTRRNIRHVKYRKTRESNDLDYKLRRILRNRLNMALKNKQKVGSAVSDLGCSVAKLKIHLQLKFHRNPRGKHEYMTWENHGFMGWHIDHIKPLASFDLTDPIQLKEACNYTNLRPMWSRDNMSKGDNYEPQ